ncbi:MAG TPA: FAD-binding oxidoreductase [Verrucomicrobiae bacterium]|nr:FAD-binding oxidoreductase [Verrucomicrobiae bacterium]
MSREAVEMAVGAVVIEVGDVKTIRLNWPAGYDMAFKTGQFITCFWPDEPAYKRAYSLSSCALDPGYYEFTVRRDGKMGTRLVDWIKPEQRLMVLPPAGKFLPVYEPDKHLICIAGGSGVAPFRGFFREAARRKLETKITILYSARTDKDIIFREEFQRLQQENPNLHFQVTCTRLTAEDSWAGRRGRIDAAWIKEHIQDLSRSYFYACGPNALVEFAEGMVFELGVPRGKMKTEKWG